MKIFRAQDEKYFPDAAAFCPHRYTDEEATTRTEQLSVKPVGN
jgi:hypothetical protein